jgi:flagellar biosynthesis protein FlhG
MNNPKVISFSSGKGGVGKTSLVANLGKLWSKTGKKTLLIDGDWALGKLSMTLGVRPQWTVDSVVNESITIHQAVEPVAENLFLLASPSGVMGFEELTESHRNHIFFEIEHLVNDYDLVLFDHSSGIHWSVLQFAAASHEQVIVTTPEPTSYTDAYAIMKILSKRFSVKEFSLLVTMSQNRAETEKIIAQFANVVRMHLGVRIRVLDIFPWEPNVSASIRSQKLFVDSYPIHGFTHQLVKVREALDDHVSNASGGLNFAYTGESAR